MKITIPENQSEITLGQYQKCLSIAKKDISEDEKDKEVIEVILGINKNDVGSISQKDREELARFIKEAIEVTAKFSPTFTLNENRYGLIPRLSKDNVTGDEYTDLVKYGASEWDTMHCLMAVLFRPIVKEIGNTYEIEVYEGTEGHRDEIKEMPLSLVNSALGFFLTLREELQAHILKYSDKEQAREIPL